MLGLYICCCAQESSWKY